MAKTDFWAGAEYPIAIAHRGGAGLSKDAHLKQNTLASFLRAKSLGYIYLETDVICTADNQVIAVHVAMNRIAAVLHLKDSPNHHKLEKLKHKQVNDLLGRDIPTIQEVMRALPECKFIIDTKTDKVVQPLAQIIVSEKAQGRVCVNSFYAKRVEQFQKLTDGRVCTAIIFARLGLHPVHTVRQWLRFGKLRVDAAVLPYGQLNKVILRYLRNRRVKTIIWSLNKKPQIKRALELEVDGIMSDNIELLKELLNSYKHKK